uniref:Uncharacterized protein n=1 Tax=Parascaris univalens TaxID=6257 RepID=A0A915C879_PARUN
MRYQPLISIHIASLLAHVRSNPLPDADSSLSFEDIGKFLRNSTHAVDFSVVLYRRCCIRCWLSFQSRIGNKSLISLAQEHFREEDHLAYCSAYNETRQCVRSCVPSDEQMAHVRPFFRRNYLNEMLCIKHYDEFREHLPCYWNERKSLEYFLVRCGYFALDDSTSLKATKITCKALSCVLRAIPETIRRECEDAMAAEFMEKIVRAFLRERIRLNKMKRMCAEQFV